MALLLSNTYHGAEGDEDNPFITDDAYAGQPVSKNGVKGTGETPWWIWLIIGVLLAAVLACLAYGCYQKMRADRVQGDLDVTKSQLHASLSASAAEGMTESLLAEEDDNA